jgi:hypothetical protein
VPWCVDRTRAMVKYKSLALGNGQAVNAPYIVFVSKKKPPSREREGGKGKGDEIKVLFCAVTGGDVEDHSGGQHQASDHVLQRNTGTHQLHTVLQ